jgi:hypothetical protein
MPSGKYGFDRKRPISWSYLSSFQYDREEWFRRYILGMEDRETPELRFGKALADSIENGTCSVPGLMELLPYKKEVAFNVVVAGMHLRGFLDDFDTESFTHINEVKTGTRPWTQKRADAHGQITMYCLMNYAKNRVRPEDVTCTLIWLPTVRKETGSFDTEISFENPVRIETFETRRTMRDIAEFTGWIMRTLDDMEEFVSRHE